MSPVPIVSRVEKLFRDLLNLPNEHSLHRRWQRADARVGLDVARLHHDSEPAVLRVDRDVLSHGNLRAETSPNGLVSTQDLDPLERDVVVTRFARGSRCGRSRRWR